MNITEGKKKIKKKVKKFLAANFFNDILIINLIG